MPVDLFADEKKPQGVNLFADEGPSQDKWKSTEYGFKVRDAITPSGKPTVQRDDGMVWFGPDQGNKGKPGWFNDKGLRAGGTPNQPTAFMDTFSNDMVSKRNETDRLPLLGRLVPAQVAGMTKGLMDTVLAPAQAGAHLLGSNAMDPIVNALDQNYRQNWQQSAGGEMLGQALPFIATAGGSLAAQVPVKALSAAGRVRAALATIAKSSATGAAASAGLTPETGVTSDSDFWSRKGEKARMGAMVGGTLGAVAPVVESIAGRLKAPLTPEAQAIQDLGDQFGVRTLAPDLAANRPGLAKTAVLAESIPGSGMVGERVAQQAEARAAAEKLLAQHGIEGEVPTTIQKSLQGNLNATKGRVRSAYDAVAREADGLGEVPLDGPLAEIQKARTIEESAINPNEGLVGLLKKMEGRISGGNKSGAVDEITGLPLNEDGTVTLFHGTSKSGAEGIRASGKLKSAGEPDVYLTTAKEGTGYGDGTVVPVRVKPSQLVLDDAFPNGRMDFRIPLKGPGSSVKAAIETPSVDTTYTGVRGLRSNLGNMISDYYKGTNATTGSQGVQVLQGIKKSVEKALGEFTDAAGGDVARLARNADSLYKNELIPLKDQVIRSATKNSEPDQIYKAIVGAGKDRAQKFYSALEPDGQAAVRAQMVQDAFKDATKVDGVFSPAQFAKSLEGIKESTGVFFKGQDKFELDGFTNLMRHVQRAGQVNENPPTGQRLLMGLLGGEAIHGVGSMLGHGPEAAATAFGTMAAGSAGARALTKMFASKAGKSFLLGASGLNPGSPAMEKLVERELPVVLGLRVAGASNVTPLQPLSPLKIAETEPEPK